MSWVPPRATIIQGKERTNINQQLFKKRAIKRCLKIAIMNSTPPALKTIKLTVAHNLFSHPASEKRLKLCLTTTYDLSVHRPEAVSVPCLILLPVSWRRAKASA